MITKTNAVSCKVFYMKSNGKAITWKANGKCIVWKTRSEDFKLPIKHGLYDYAYITQENAHLFFLTEQEARLV